MLKKGGSFACAIRKLEGKEEPVLDFKLRVGARVKIKPNSRFYHGSNVNPIDVEGEVHIFCDPSYDGDLNVEVRWDNGCQNSYTVGDLEVVG